MSRYTIEGETLTDIADAIRAVAGGESLMTPAQMTARLLATRAIADNFAPEYDDAATYAVGDYCMHENSLHCCSTAIPTAEAWNAAHWTEVSFAGEVGNLKTAMGDVADLTTTTKESVVDAIDELAGQVYDVVTSGSDTPVNLYDNASEDMQLNCTGGHFETSDTRYGFYVSVHDYQGQVLAIERTNVGAFLIVAFSINVPANGVSTIGIVLETNTNYNAVSVPSNAEYMYVMYYSSSDTYTREQLLAGMQINPATLGDANLYDEASGEMMLSFSSGSFSSASSLYGFYVPIDSSNYSHCVITRTNNGKRFRCAFSEQTPAVGVSFTGYAAHDERYSMSCVIPSGANYLYVAFYSSSQDTLTKEQLLAGMSIRYVTVNQGQTVTNVPKNVTIYQGAYNAGKVMAANGEGKIKPVTVVDAVDGVAFENKTINASNEVVDSTTHILSGYVQTYGRFGVTCPSSYLLKTYLFDTTGTPISSDEITNKTKYYSNVGYARFDIAASDSSTITPDTVNFAQIKLPCNRLSVVGFAKEQTYVLDAENSMCADVFAYIDDAVAAHGMYATKTLLCTETSGISTYYYTLGSGAKKICLVGGQHGSGSDGDPRDSVITVAKITHDLINGDFADTSFLRKMHDEYTVLVIPILNAYGFNNNTRTDANDVDPNRDWTAGATIEVAAAKLVLSAFEPDIVLDVHCNGTTPIVDVDVDMQVGFGSTQNPLFKAAVASYFGTYYNITVDTRNPNSDATLQVYARDTLGALGGLLELKYWLKNKKWMHDYQAESGNYAMVINSLKYFDSVGESETYVFEHTPNQNQY